MANSHSDSENKAIFIDALKNFIKTQNRIHELTRELDLIKEESRQFRNVCKLKYYVIKSSADKTNLLVNSYNVNYIVEFDNEGNIISCNKFDIQI